MASSSAIPNASSFLQLRIKSVSSQCLRRGVRMFVLQPRICDFETRIGYWDRVAVLWMYSSCLRTSNGRTSRRGLFAARSCSAPSFTNSSADAGVPSRTVDVDSDGVVKVAREGRENAVLGNALSRMQLAISSLPPVISTMKRNNSSKLAVGFFLVFACLVVVVRATIFRRPRHSQHGSVADLVKRGQLKSHSRGISRPLKYEDPFNNPLVRVGKNNSTVEMCGKVYHLAPVTLTKEQQSSHQKRRSRAYKWKRPTIFLKEGDAIPPDVDPDTVRWIPANHPFATTVSDIDEELAQSNIYQKTGVPFRIKAEHEALQRKLEALQNEQKLNKVAINPSNVHEFERTSKSFLETSDEMELNLAGDQHYGDVNNARSCHTLDSVAGDTSEERWKS